MVDQLNHTEEILLKDDGMGHDLFGLEAGFQVPAAVELKGRVNS